jgi:hypothetical protein
MILAGHMTPFRDVISLKAECKKEGLLKVQVTRSNVAHGSWIDQSPRSWSIENPHWMSLSNPKAILYVEAITWSFQIGLSFAWNAGHPLPSSSVRRCFSLPSRAAAPSAEVLAARSEKCTQQFAPSVVKRPYCPSGSVVIGQRAVATASSAE